MAEARGNINGEQEKEVKTLNRVSSVEASHTKSVTQTTVRYKLDVARNRLCEKISQRARDTQNHIHNKKVKGCIHVMKPLDPQSRGRFKFRHFNLLKAIESNNGDCIDEIQLAQQPERSVVEEAD